MSDGHVVLKIEGDDSGLRNTMKSLAVAAGSMAESVSEALGAIDGHGAGLNAAMGVAAGISAGTGVAVAAARNLAGQVAAAMRAELGIQSPSKVAEEIALHFDAGLVEGLLGGAGNVFDAAKLTANGIMDAVQAGLHGAGPAYTHGGAYPADPGAQAAGQRVVIDFASGSDAKRLLYAYVEEGGRLVHG